MESQSKEALGYEAKGSAGGASRSACGVVLRLLSVAATMSAAIVMALDKETETVNVSIAPTLPPLPVAVTAKSSYSSAFMYFVAANAIACGYSALSAAASVAGKGRRGGLPMMVDVADVMVLALLFSGLGAAGAIGVVGEKGISNVGWNKVCDVYTKFCAKVVASLAVSFVACLAYLALVLLALAGLHKRSP